MSSFTDWGSIQAGESYEVGGNAIVPLPDGTVVRGVVEAVKHKHREQNTANPLEIEITLRVLEPEAYANRLVWLKLKINDLDPKRAGEAHKKLAVIDHQLSAFYKVEPTQQTLMQCLIERQQPYEDVVSEEYIHALWVGQGDQMLTVRMGLVTLTDGSEMNFLQHILPAGTEGQMAPERKQARSAPAPMPLPPAPGTKPKAASLLKPAGIPKPPSALPTLPVYKPATPVNAADIPFS